MPDATGPGPAGYAYPEPRYAEPRFTGEPRDRSWPPAQRVAPARVEPPPQPVDDDSEESVLASTGSMAIATLISRITGFFRILLMAAVLGGGLASAFNVANTLPNMISELVLGSVLSAIVVPVLVRAEREDDDGGTAFVRRLLTVSITILGLATLASVAGAPLLTRLMLGDGKVNESLSTAFAYFLLPQILFYGLAALFTAILNTRSVFKPGAWAPVTNNIVAIAVLVLYFVMPGEISLDPVQMGSPKLIVLGVGTTLGVVTQALVLVPALRRQQISLRPLWGIDARLKRFGGMGLAIVLYVLISQVGLVVTTNVASQADASSPAIYSFVWMLLQVPYGVLGVTLLTAIMPKLSRDAAADDTPAVVDGLTSATKLTMVALVPIIVFMTLAGPTIGEALFAYGNFGADDAHRLGLTLSWSAFTLIPYAFVLLHLRVFYAREQAWTPTFIIIGITAVKIVLSLLAPMLVPANQVVVALGTANGLGFVAGALVGGMLLKRSLGDLHLANVGRTVGIVIGSSLAGGVVMLVLDAVLQLHSLTTSFGGLGAVARVVVDAVLMLGVTFLVLRKFKVPEVVAVTVAVGRLVAKLRGRPAPESAGTEAAGQPAGAPTGRNPVPYAEARRVDTGRFDRPTYPGRGAIVSDSDAAAANPTGAQQASNTRPDPDAPRAPRRHVPDLMVDTGVLPLGAMPPMRASGPGDAPRRPVRGPRLIPGAAVAGGRYRLLAHHGGANGLQFWQAVDTKLDREVALTFVDADQQFTGPDRAEGPQAVLSRTLRLGRINSNGLARVLDVVRGSSGGIVVAEWTPGSSLREVAATSPSPLGSARAVRALAAAAESAHRAGTALSIDHPDRIRISSDGAAVLAFPASLADADQSTDVRGLGATLYALLTDEWPLEDKSAVDGPPVTVGGMKQALLDPKGLPTEPRKVRPEIPFEISAVAMRSIQGDSGIRTAATVQHVLDQASVVDQKTDLMHAATGAPAGGPAPEGPTERTPGDQAKRKRMIISLSVLGVAVLIVLGFVVQQLTGIFGANDSSPLPDQNIGLTTSPAPTSVAPSPTAPAPPSKVVIPALSASVFSPQGTPDDASGAKLAIDGNPSTTWSTDQYYQPFPALKNGIGLMVTLKQPTKLISVGVESPSPGTRVEIRSAPSADATLDQTQVIGSQVLGNGHTEIPVQSDQTTRYVLVWITALGKADGQNQSKIGDLTFTGAA
ncbi:murein biosynthesis integral membrane protein MurJ [Speluncibacter jeojiensis]|uniref:Murein biosynthesis integral membrane protein MurJ n=1 Tax=Speluncibacter jeojiensis TaxID=2710754 RepID=A0A9X4LY88_9ACTN|nr:murein biosynthesis integral membrane protein MurJ [Rhodococcus sp. D2-41]MDG3014565.1 murein biosynthesis integral membrane protein MurJ [Corynebacteriales bacterium D3-21]